ncbi:putative QCR9-ubiquinol--cytochrome-c reductase subunit 9 [Ramicandelaber brevisporus]|nr:putative QCR9-ubiquinol--cytochrome-c reductase subunit 9 [Ramicandelaber brevisporus]
MPSYRASNTTLNSFSRGLYQTVIRRNSTFMSAIVVGGLAFGAVFIEGTQAWFDYHNKGKQWKDIKHRYENN